jgi:hypothetical protein
MSGEYNNKMYNNELWIYIYLMEYVISENRKKTENI